MRWWLPRHKTWIVVLPFAALAALMAADHPMHTEMSAFEHYMRCYGAAFAGPFGVWLLPCCRCPSPKVLFVAVPCFLLFGTSALYWRKRIRPFRILLALAICYWLLVGMAALGYYK